MRLIALSFFLLLAACADPTPKSWPCAATRCEWQPINGAPQ